MPVAVRQAKEQVLAFHLVTTLSSSRPGSTEVDTQPGEFTEFKVILPRTAATSKKGATR
jgi:hypothetical protein